MKRSVIVLVSAAVLSGFASLAGAQSKIGVVDPSRLMQEAPQGQAVQQAINSEFLPRGQEIQAQDAALKAREDRLNRDAATMSEVQRSAAERELQSAYRALQLKQAEFQEDLNARRNEELQKLNILLLEEVQNFAVAEGYDLILADGVLFATAAVDVTPAVLRALQNRGNRPAAAPARP